MAALAETAATELEGVATLLKEEAAVESEESRVEQGAEDAGEEEGEVEGFPQLGAEFSEAYAQSGGAVHWSPSGKLIAVANDNRLVVRNASTLQIVQLFSCTEKIDHLEWSHDSKFVLCAMYRRSLVQVWCVEDDEWTCRITEGLAGLVHAQCTFRSSFSQGDHFFAETRRFAPLRCAACPVTCRSFAHLYCLLSTVYCIPPHRSGYASFHPAGARHRHEILTFADFGLHITVWSLRDGKGVLIPSPKTADGATFGRPSSGGAQSCALAAAAASAMVSFSSTGDFLAVAERESCKDMLAIYECETWECVRRFPVATRDLQAVRWSPDDAAIALTDTPLTHAEVVYAPDGSLLGRLSSYEDALGVKGSEWSRTGQFLAVGSSFLLSLSLSLSLSSSLPPLSSSSL